VTWCNWPEGAGLTTLKHEVFLNFHFSFNDCKALLFLESTRKRQSILPDDDKSMKYFLSLFTLTILLAACAGKQEEKNKTTAADTVQAAATPAPPEWYKRFEGTVAGMPVVANLHKWGNVLNGSYYYLKTVQPIALYNWSDTTRDDEEWLLTENPSSERPDDRKDATWLVSLKGEKLTGSWTAASGKKQTIDLHEAYGSESIELGLLYVADSARIADTMQQPHATATTALLQPQKDMADAPRAFIEIALRKALGCSSDSLDIMGCIHRANEKYFADWRRLMEEETNSYGDLQAFHNNHTADYSQEVVYNDNGWLIVESMNSDYTGGAHGNYASSFLNLDWKGQQSWVLTDVFNKRDTAQLVPLLQAAARRYFKIGKSQSLGGYLFDSKIPVTSNFYIVPGGLVFLYNPYEIAAYAAGQICLYLKYEEVKPWLTKAFKERMGIQ
jgi:hypothetical protein